MPLPYNGLAELPSAETRKELVELCGAKWTEGPICCDDAQVGPQEDLGFDPH